MPAKLTDDPRWKTPWAHEAAELAGAQGLNLENGLSDLQVLQRRRISGPNVLRETKPRSRIAMLFAQFRSVVVLLLCIAVGLSAAMGEVVEAMAIAAVIAINALIGFVTEWRATRSMEALRRFARSKATVVRNGHASGVFAADLVPGDIVMLKAGDAVPADLRLVDVADLQINESALTGESLPIRKHTEVISEAATLLERSNIAYRGTTITRGSGRGLVVETGMQTEFGRIFAQVSAAEPRQTPLEKRLDALGQRLAWAALVMALLLAIVGVISGRELFLAIEVAIALCIAAIPEGLPVVATIALARGMWRMARRNALITRLSAVETLGATSIILTDKTGTLTESRMTVTRILLSDSDVVLQETAEINSAEPLGQLLLNAALCCNATLGEGDDPAASATGDPTEIALLVAAAQAGLDRPALLDKMPRQREEPFDSKGKRMATIHRSDEGVFAAVKGAPEALLPLCNTELTTSGERALQEADRARWLTRAEALASLGLRTLAVAQCKLSSAEDSPYENLQLLGILSMEDPAREGVREAIEHCHRAGMEVVMVTGDHPATARSIALETGILSAQDPGEVIVGAQLQKLLESSTSNTLLDARVFARVTPEQKLCLIDLHQNAGRVVAMTGDGVNDAPALKKADIGVAMGIRGTAVAREAAAMVLQDDEFGTIVAAVEHGRAIFTNIRKFVLYLLSCNISEVLVVVIAMVAGAPLPLLPLQILFLNLVTDVFPALALGVGSGPPGAMLEPPRPASERILMRVHWLMIIVYGSLIAVSVLGAMAIAVLFLDFGTQRAVTVSFLTLALGQMWHVFNMRDDSARWLNNEITGNPWVWVALLLCLILLAAAVYLPPLASVLSLSAPGASGWLLIVTASCIPVLFGPALKHVALRLSKSLNQSTDEPSSGAQLAR
ncbi:cation-transporting P-type ATPase [Congregibacter variabilis]|uniref:Cation-transporting P-type ATPase n=1 Tax=Congregibacter variabilis TaxID=3081200 RepID=A0ABZ0I3K0_9GAMM|nr:cation-transporting P-type ATPase [Congregibacter sp. IMCC43200]